MQQFFFIEIKAYLLSILREYTIDDLNFRKHPYFIYDENESVYINHKMLYEKIKLKYDFDMPWAAVIDNDLTKYPIHDQRKVEIFVLQILGIEFRLNRYEHHFKHSELFDEIFPRISTIKTLEWKEPLLEALNCDMPENVFGLFYDGFYCISNQFRYDFYPIWAALKSALKTNEIIKNTSNIFYVNFNNGIYASMRIRKNTIDITDLTVAMGTKEQSRFSNDKYYSKFYVFGAEFYLPNLIILNYNKWTFEINFNTNSLLFNNGVGNMIAHNIADEIEE